MKILYCMDGGGGYRLYTIWSEVQENKRVEVQENKRVSLAQVGMTSGWCDECRV